VQQAISHEPLEPVVGDFFQSVPSGADAYILRWIIHDWSEAEAGTLLGKVREAMKLGARLVLLEEIIPETRELVPGKWIDLLMLSITGGEERTENIANCAQRRTSNLEEVVPTAGPLSLLVAKARGMA
jgi:hypothetical protein